MESTRSAAPVVGQRLEALVSAMGRFMGKTLALTDPEVNGVEGVRLRNAKGAPVKHTKMTYGTLMYEEIRYLPQKKDMDQLEAMFNTWTFAEQSESLARHLIADRSPELLPGAEAEQDRGRTPCVALSNYARHPAYYEKEEHRRESGGMLVLGSIGQKLQDEVTDMATEWLLQLDMIICQVHGYCDDEPLHSGRAWFDIAHLITQFADAIGKRHALTQPLPDAMLDVDPLRARFLETRAEMEFTRTTAQAETRARVDMEALQFLLVIAKHGASTDEARTILLTRTAHLSHIVSKPPVELGLVGENARRMNFELLKRMLRTGTPIDVKSSLADYWSATHGAYARTAIGEAIRKLSGWSPKTHTRFIPTVTRRATPHELPPMRWAPALDQWHVMETRSSTRTGLDAQGERVVAFTSAVWELVAGGAFQQGVVSKAIVDAVAVEALQHANIMKVAIDNHRKHFAIGTRLHEALESLHDRESMLSDDVALAVCELRDFSLIDILNVFGPTSNVLADLLPTLALRARDCCTTAIPAEYTRFVTDALALFLPVICERRDRLQIQPHDRPNPLGEMLRALPGLAQRANTAAEEVISIDAKDLQPAHPATRATLEAVARRSAIVRAAHISKQGKPLKRQVRFWMDRSALLMLLTM